MTSIVSAIKLYSAALRASSVVLKILLRYHPQRPKVRPTDHLVGLITPLAKHIVPSLRMDAWRPPSDDILAAGQTP